MMAKIQNDSRPYFSGLRTAGAERSKIALPCYRGVQFDYVIGDHFGDSVLWIKDAYIYSFHGEVSLSFLFSSSIYKARYTARVVDRSSTVDQAGVVVLMYRVRMLVEVEDVSHAIDMLLAESAVGDTPAIMSRRDAALFSQAIQNPQ
ncbi:MAG: hypothetical protein ACSHXI_20475 [Hoeflea sp.]|uniref:hypothetical protein n=1 Tax=Hoeflea sp. TaxID=1940281 RepID=UPI003EF0FD5A